MCQSIYLDDDGLVKLEVEVSVEKPITKEKAVVLVDCRDEFLLAHLNDGTKGKSITLMISFAEPITRSAYARFCKIAGLLIAEQAVRWEIDEAMIAPVDKSNTDQVTILSAILNAGVALRERGTMERHQKKLSDVIDDYLTIKHLTKK